MTNTADEFLDDEELMASLPDETFADFTGLTGCSTAVARLHYQSRYAEAIELHMQELQITEDDLPMVNLCMLRGITDGKS